MRHRPSYANVAATIALVAALGGGTALAATHYLITSTKQIKPSVLAQLHGAAGPRGTAGAQGAPGAQGVQGAQGPAGPTGAAGAVAGYEAPTTSGSNAVTFTGGTLGSPTTILTKSLPAGSFLINAKTVITASTTSAPSANPYIDATCQLVDGSATDTAWWSSPFSNESDFGLYVARSTVAMDIAVTSAVATTVTLSCDVLASSGSPGAAASYPAIQAVQTSSNS